MNNGTGKPPSGERKLPEGEPSPEQLAEARMVGFVMHAAGCSQEAAVKVLQQQFAEVEPQLGPYLENLISPERHKTHPTLGVRLHWPNGEQRTDVVGPKRLTDILQASAPADQGGDLSAYAMTLALAFSPMARAVLAAQGYHVEFLEAKRAPRKSPLLI